MALWWRAGVERNVWGSEGLTAMVGRVPRSRDETVTLHATKHYYYKIEHLSAIVSPDITIRSRVSGTIANHHRCPASMIIRSSHSKANCLGGTRGSRTADFSGVRRNDVGSLCLGQILSNSFGMN